ncbi:MAG: hypothetical protein NVS3B20_04280 [Polyangiales bacterium]
MTASELVARLKVLPRAAAEALLRELGVQRVRDLKASEASRAHAMVAKVEAGIPSQEAAEIDPFL